MEKKDKTAKGTTSRKQGSSVEALVRILESLNFREARQAARVLGETRDLAAVKPLLATVRESAALRAAAMAALKKIASENDAVATELAMALMAEKQPPERGMVADDRRRSHRVLLEIPVVVRWQDARGEAREELSTARLVNAYGALLALREVVPEGTQLELTNALSRAKTTARVIWCGDSVGGRENELGIELAEAEADFWVGTS